MRIKLFLYLFVAVLIAGTAAQASNMGFKITIPLDDSGTLKQNWFSLPYNVSYALAGDIRNDIAACDRVYRWVAATDTFEYWTGRSGTNFSIDATQAYMVTVTGPENWVVVGSHDPAGVANIEIGGSLNQNWISVPYHTTATDAGTLRTELLNDSVDVDRVYRWVAATDTFEYWTGRSGTNFGLVPGMGYMITVLETAGQTWTPEHY
jgi:hypothetical protein